MFDELIKEYNELKSLNEQNDLLIRKCVVTTLKQIVKNLNRVTVEMNIVDSLKIIIENKAKIEELVKALEE
jgi:arginyl-tRNA synthetase